jgi:hypothetical protein
MIFVIRVLGLSLVCPVALVQWGLSADGWQHTSAVYPRVSSGPARFHDASLDQIAELRRRPLTARKRNPPFTGDKARVTPEPVIRRALHGAVGLMRLCRLRATAHRPTDLSDGQISGMAVQPPCEKFFAFPFGRNRNRANQSRPERGALAIVTNVGAGCGGRGSVGRANVIAGRVQIRERSQRADERLCCGRQSRVVLTPRRRRQVQRRFLRARPGGQSHIRWMTVTNKPDRRGEHEAAVKTIACGNAG